MLHNLTPLYLGHYRVKHAKSDRGDCVLTIIIFVGLISAAQYPSPKKYGLLSLFTLIHLECFHSLYSNIITQMYTPW